MFRTRSKAIDSSSRSLTTLSWVSALVVDARTDSEAVPASKVTVGEALRRLVRSLCVEMRVVIKERADRKGAAYKNGEHKCPYGLSRGQMTERTAASAVSSSQQSSVVS